jgi:multidrug efflux pump
VQIFGSGDYSMRIWIDPQKAAEHNLAASDITDAIRAQNVQAAAGTSARRRAFRASTSS